MAITKTNFINYTRCPRYVALEEIKKDKLTSNMTLEEYKNEEQNEQIKELLGQLFEVNEDDEEIDLTKKTDIQLEAMMKYYREVEIESGRIVDKVFGGKSVYNTDTYKQESFDFSSSGINYLCYVDIYNKQDDCINIIEVKATTSNKYLKLEYGKLKGEKFPLFLKKNNIFYVSPCIDDNLQKEYETKRNKLKNRFSEEGRYIYDLAVQRYIIENDFKQHNINCRVNYYLAVLNADYIYDGYMENNKSVYRTIDNEEIVSLFEFNDITKEMQKEIDAERINLERNLLNPNPNPCPVGVYCNLKKNTECIYKAICFKNVPIYNTSFNYLNFRGFKNEKGDTFDKYDLINNGYYKLDDIPYEWLTNKNHIIQRDCYDNNKVYVNKEKIGAFLNEIEYPIYHLDFESFPCPMPRFRGEKPYSQSCFEFSLHIENSPGVCDKEKDNFVFLAKSSKDERKDLVKALVENIPCDKGTMLAQNVSFEQGRIKELAEIFPEYKDHLLKIRERGYDLLYIIRNNSKIAESLGFTSDANEINYYNSKQSGSYSIKKTLPLFTNLKYSDLEVQNGTEALVEYSKYDFMSAEELNQTRKNLIEYCKQDTWAMVEILRGLRKTIE